jgi:hypothetical protein
MPITALDDTKIEQRHHLEVDLSFQTIWDSQHLTRPHAEKRPRTEEAHKRFPTRIPSQSEKQTTSEGLKPKRYGPP